MSIHHLKSNPQREKNREKEKHKYKELIHDSLFRHFLGRHFNDSAAQLTASWLPYKTIDEDGKFAFELKLPSGTIKRVTPEDVSAVVLREMKLIAESYLGERITHAIIAVPAYVNDDQRLAIKNAGATAGIRVLSTVKKPIAAAMAHDLAEIENREQLVKVYDIDASTTDIAFISIDLGVHEILAYSSTHLGGNNFTQRVVDYLVKEFNKKNSVDITADYKAMQRLHHAVEGAKRDLSYFTSSRIHIKGFFQDKEFSESLTRAKFEELNTDLFQQILKPTRQLLGDGVDNMNVSDDMVTDVIVVGGSGYILSLQRLIGDHFRDKLRRSINPDEAIALGAAKIGYVLGSDDGSTTCGFIDYATNNLSLGVKIAGGLMAV